MKLYPKKAMASVFILSFLFDLGLLLVVVAVNNPGINKIRGVKLFFVFLFIIIYLTLVTAVKNSIILTNEMLVIKFEKHNLWPKKYIIPLKEIKVIASADIKRRFVKDKIFAIRFKEAQEEKILWLNQTIYFIKDLECLFSHLEKNYNIPYIRM